MQFFFVSLAAFTETCLFPQISQPSHGALYIFVKITQKMLLLKRRESDSWKRYNNNQGSTKLPVFPTASEMRDSYPLVLQECSQTCATKPVPTKWWDQLVTALNAVVLFCLYRNVLIPSFSFVLCARCTGLFIAGMHRLVLPSFQISVIIFQVQSCSFMSRLHSRFSALSRCLA